MGIAHRALDYKEWFVKTVTVVNNTFGVYVNPVTWVNRHRLHHKFSDHPGDPNKLASDGFWRTLYLCLLPYKCQANVANDEIFKSWSFRLVSNPVVRRGCRRSSISGCCGCWWATCASRQ